MAAASSGPIGQQLSREELEYIVHHVFLPPKLPQSDDHTPELASALLRTTIESLRAFTATLQNEQKGAAQHAVQMLINMEAVHCLSSGDVSEQELAKALSELCKKGERSASTSDFLICDSSLAVEESIALHIRAQNAGVLISKVENEIHFETFELSPTNKAVYAGNGRLRRSFPGAARTVGIQTFNQKEFQATVAHTLSTMSHQKAAGTLSQVRKAGQEHDEDRDTIHPRLVSELFMNFLAPLGGSVDVTVIAKNTREEVFWQKARSPWRRSPFWLLIRVSLQLMLGRQISGTKKSHELFKSFTVFFLSEILERSQARLPAELLHVMSSKIARRLIKLGPDFQSSRAHTTLQASSAKTEKAWATIGEREQRNLELSNLTKLDFDEDTILDMSLLDAYIDSISSRQAKPAASPFKAASGLITHSPGRLPDLSALDVADLEYLSQNLQSFEAWIDAYLPQWVQAHKHEAETCTKVSELIRSYHKLAARHYSGKPEAISIMLLTIFELWIACDRAAVTNCPLLGNYNPDLPTGVLPSLLLPRKRQMERLRAVEKYLADRHALVHKPPSRLYIDVKQDDCFAAKFFDQSLEHRKLLEDITLNAERKKAAKVEELNRLKRQHSDLMQRHNQASHEYHDVVVDPYNDFHEQQHSKNRCKKCRLQKQAEDMQITVHEWPLPRNGTEAKVVTFELRVPPWFASWRDITMQLRKNILKSQYPMARSPSTKYWLSKDPHLSSLYYVPAFRSRQQRITLLSDTKPHVVTHREQRPVSWSSERDVCLHSGLTYHYYDKDEHSECFVQELRSTSDAASDCTYKLPPQSKALQQFMSRPEGNVRGRPPNRALATQQTCPDHMAFEEYQDLAGLLSGCRTQWRAMLPQLAHPSLDFRKEETTLVFLQCLHQAGVATTEGDLLRVGHQFCRDSEATSALLSALGEALDRTKENWESVHAISVFSALAARILSLSSAPNVQKSCIKFLSEASEVALRWLNLLREKIQQAGHEDDRISFQSRALEVALVCAGCLDTDDEHLRSILSRGRNASALIQCSIVIHETRLVSKNAGSLIAMRLLAHQRMLLRSLPILSAHPTAIGHAIEQSWSAYRAEAKWDFVERSNSHWLVTQTTSTGTLGCLVVHYNVLSGELLVNGLPLDRPPDRYVQHPSYKILFKTSAIEVVPSTIPAMDFTGKRTYAGYTFHLGFASSHLPSGPVTPDLLVQANKEGTKYETLPPATS